MDPVRKERGMARCPECGSVRVVIVVSPDRRAFCVRCGTRWVQDGIQQRSIQRLPRLATDPTSATPA